MNDDQDQPTGISAHERYPTSLSKRILQGVGVVSALAALVIGFTTLVQNFEELITETDELISRICGVLKDGACEKDAEEPVTTAGNEPLSTSNDEALFATLPIDKKTLIGQPTIRSDGVTLERYITRYESGMYLEHLLEIKQATLNMGEPYTLASGDTLELVEIFSTHCAIAIRVIHTQTYSQFVSAAEGFTPESDADLKREVVVEECEPPTTFTGDAHGWLAEIEIETVISPREVSINIIDVEYGWWHPQEDSAN